MSSAWIVLRRVVAGAAVATLLASALPVVATMSLDELEAANLRAWNDPDVELITELYAPDAVHTATFYDRTHVVEGAEVIAGSVSGAIVPAAPRIDIPAMEGEYRWADFIDLAGGTACLWHALDGQIVRQDCLLPENSMDSRPAAGLRASSPSATVLDLGQRLSEAWAGRDLGLLEAVYAPDAIHSARFTNKTKRYEGPAEILRVAQGLPIQQIGPIVEFQAPEGRSWEAACSRSPIRSTSQPQRANCGGWTSATSDAVRCVRSGRRTAGWPGTSASSPLAATDIVVARFAWRSGGRSGAVVRRPRARFNGVCTNSVHFVNIRQKGPTHAS